MMSMGLRTQYLVPLGFLFERVIESGAVGTPQETEEDLGAKWVTIVDTGQETLGDYGLSRGGFEEAILYWVGG